jgi:hypothetical protein
VSYLSAMSVDVAIREECVEEVRAYIARARRTRKDDFRLYFLRDLYVDDDGRLEYPDDLSTRRQWYHDDQFAAWLKRYCTEGTITFLGEDGHAWATSSTARAGPGA